MRFSVLPGVSDTPGNIKKEEMRAYGEINTKSCKWLKPGIDICINGSRIYHGIWHYQND